jgi:protein O-mannosyl-transferase
LAAGLIALLATAAYVNSFVGPFLFDGILGIAQNPVFRELWPPWAPMTGTARPFADWSFAVNYALGGINTWGYHAVNLAIHTAAALALFGIVRRTLLSARLAARFAAAAWGLALAVAILWLLHPLQTQSVTYIYQRYESLMGLFILLTLYGFIRAQDASHPNRWYVVSVVCCLLAMTSKEVAAVAPLLVLWYDRAMVASSWREIIHRRRGYYAGLIGAWVILAGLMLRQAGKFAEAGVLVVPNVTPWQYAVTQPGVIAHYLRLCFWPVGLCIDYGWPVADTLDAIILPTLLIVALLALTAWAIFRWPEWSFLGAWFFLILAPTSSVFPIRDLAFEHRMYLPLAAVVVGVVIGGHLVGQWLVGGGRISRSAWQAASVSLLIFIAVAFGVLTFERNAQYRDDLSIWEDTVAKAPGNGRAHNNLGGALTDRHRLDEAIVHLHRALEITPNFVEAHNNLGNALRGKGSNAEAIIHLRRATELSPQMAECHYNLANALVKPDQFDEMVAEYGKALEIRPDYAEAHSNLGAALVGRGRLDEAIVHFQQALELKPDYVDARHNLDIVRSQLETTHKALAERRELLRARPDDISLLNDTAWMLATNPNVSIRNGVEAVELAQRAVQLSGGREPAVLGTLAAAQAETGRFSEAIETAQQALALASSQNNSTLADSLRARIRLYQAGSPHDDVQQLPVPKSNRP